MIHLHFLPSFQSTGRVNTHNRLVSKHKNIKTSRPQKTQKLPGEGQEMNLICLQQLQHHSSMRTFCLKMPQAHSKPKRKKTHTLKIRWHFHICNSIFIVGNALKNHEWFTKIFNFNLPQCFQDPSHFLFQISHSSWNIVFPLWMRNSVLFYNIISEDKS